ncbi:MAG: hypothetical protein ACI9MC_000797, partial [Kiritimatiellia bacterium]
VLRTPAGELVLIDFGSVRDALRDADVGGSTVAGTFGFMAPEQFHGDAEPRTDLYGLGALAVALLTRKAPHLMADTQQRLRWKEHANVSDDMGLVLDKLTAQDLVDRPASAHEVREVVRRMRMGEPSGWALPEAGAQQPSESIDRPPAVGRQQISNRPKPYFARGPKITLQAASRQHLQADQHDARVGTIEQVLGRSGTITHTDEQGFTWTANGRSQTRVEIRNEALGSRTVVQESVGHSLGAIYGASAAVLGGVMGGSLWVILVSGGGLMGGLYSAALLMTALLLAVGLHWVYVTNRQRQLVQLMTVLQGSLGGPKGELIGARIRLAGPVFWSAGGAAIAAGTIAWMSLVVNGEPLVAVGASVAVGLAAVWGVIALTRSRGSAQRAPEATLARRVTHGLFDGLNSIGSLSMIALAIATWIAWDSEWFDIFWYGLHVWQWLAFAAGVLLPVWMITGALARATAFKERGRRKKLQEYPDFDDRERQDERPRKHKQRRGRQKSGRRRRH